MHVIIQAGGKGTRLESLTRNRPKCLVPVDNRPMIFWTFEAFKGADFSVICDYKADVLERYLAAFGAQYSVKIVSADGTGTISGIEQVVSQIRDDEPILINGQFIHAASSSAGVAGFFVFKNKDELRDIPREGALVPWLQGKGTTFAPLYLEHVTEVGTLSAFEAIKKPSICRPFNEVVLNDETITKRGIDEQGKKIAADEINWYKHVTALGCTSIPKLYSYEPLVMERIRGRNIFEYDCLTVTEKKKIVKSIVKALDDLHHLEPEIDAVTADLDSNYITKTFDRLQKVENLVPFAKDEYIRINGRYYKNIFYDREALKNTLRQYYPRKFCLIHGDSTFSNMLYDRLHERLVLIDPRGYFGKTKFYGDKDYDWVKVYYSLAGNYDQFNQKKFALSIGDKSVELSIKPNNWADMEEFFFENLEDVNRTKIRALHAVIWLSLTTYAWEDYDSICGAFYNGILKSADFL